MVGHGQKITLSEMRASGVRALLVYCQDFTCSHWQRLSAEECARWADDVRLSDIEPQFVCRACGHEPTCGRTIRPARSRTQSDRTKCPHECSLRLETRIDTSEADAFRALPRRLAVTDQELRATPKPMMRKVARGIAYVFILSLMAGASKVAIQIHPRKS